MGFGIARQMSELYDKLRANNKGILVDRIEISPVPFLRKSTSHSFVASIKNSLNVLLSTA